MGDIFIIKTKVVNNLTLEEYERRYKEYLPYLSKFSKQEFETNKDVLKDKNWRLINGTYYQIPDKFDRFLNKKKIVQIDNIIYGLTLEEYNKKYRNRKHRILNYSKDLISKFDNDYCNYVYKDKKYYLIHPDNYLLKSSKWCYINGAYYEMPKPPRLTWFRNLKTSTQIATCVLAGGVMCAAIITPTILLHNNVIQDSIYDILPKQSEYRELIIENFNLSNTKVVLGVDFNTTLSIKTESYDDYNIDDIDVYTYVENKTSVNSSINSSSSNELVRIKLNKDTDYKVNNYKKYADIVVYSKAFNNKLELDIKLKDASFKNLVSFKDYTKGYDGNEYAVKVKVKQGKTLPSDTQIVYTYNDQEKYNDDCFTFTNVGEYKVDVNITANDFVPYSGSMILTISKSELPETEKSEIYFDSTTLIRKKGEIQHPTVVYESSIPSIEQTPFEYKINNNWTTSLPTETGKYEIRKTFKFTNYNDYTLNGEFRVEPWAEIKLTFKLPDGASWSKGGSSETKTSNIIEVLPTGTAFKIFKQSAGVNSDPYLEGHSFLGWYSGDTKFTDDSLVLYNADFEVTAKFNVNQYALKFDGNGGTAPETSLSLNYGSKIKELISGVAPAQHQYGYFKGWNDDPTSQEIIGEDVTMPEGGKTLYAIWNKYKFKFIDGDHGTVSGTTEFNNLIKLDNKPNEVTITPNAGYSFTNKYEIFVDGVSKISSFEFSDSNKLAPGKFNEPVKDDGATISLKPIFEANDILAVFEPDGGVIRKGYTPISSVNIKCDSKIIDSLTDITASRDYTKQIGWLYNGEDLVDQTMPASAITIRPKWHTYTINVLAENGEISEDTKSFANKIELYSDEFKLTPTSGYVLDHFEYSFDGSTYTSISHGMPFRPYQYESDTSNLHSSIYLKAVCVKPAETMEVILSAGEGLFNDGTDSKIINIAKGKTLNEILAITGKPTKDLLEPNKWVDENGADIDLDAQITGVDRFYALAIYGGNE